MSKTGEDGSRPPQPHRLPLGLGTALRQSLADGYTTSHLKRDVLAGLVVGVVALPLSMALAIAAGVPPQYGLYTAIVAGALAAALGGSAVLVTGPTAAFVVLLAPLSAKYGVAGLCVTTMMAGAMLLIMGGLRLGRLIEYIPYPVTVGFTGGIAIVIATLQLRDFLGLTIGAMPDHFPERVLAIGGAIPGLQWTDLTVGGVTLALLLLWPRVPAPLAAMALVTIAVAAVHAIRPEFNPATIAPASPMRPAA